MDRISFTTTRGTVSVLLKVAAGVKQSQSRRLTDFKLRQKQSDLCLWNSESKLDMYSVSTPAALNLKQHEVEKEKFSSFLLMWSELPPHLWELVHHKYWKPWEQNSI